MSDWSPLEWIGAVAGVATIAGVAFTVWWSLRKREPEPKARENAGAAQVVESPETTVVIDSPGTTVVRGDMHVRGYTVEEHERLMVERETQTRADLERAHEGEVASLRAQIAELSAREWDGRILKAVDRALSSGDFKRAEALLAEMQEQHLSASTVPAVQQQIRIHNLRAAAAVLDGNAQRAGEHIEVAASLIASVDPGAELEFRNRSAQGLQDHGARFGGDGLAEAIRLYRINLVHLDREANAPEWAETQFNLGNALLLRGVRVDDGSDSLTAAIEAYRSALEVCTREAEPENWVETQISLSGALVALGTRLGRDAGAARLAEAVRVCRDAEMVATREADADRWARVQSNLAVALVRRGEWRGGPEGLELAREAGGGWPRNAGGAGTRSGSAGVGERAIEPGRFARPTV